MTPVMMMMITIMIIIIISIIISSHMSGKMQASAMLLNKEAVKTPRYEIISKSSLRLLWKLNSVIHELCFCLHEINFLSNIFRFFLFGIRTFFMIICPVKVRKLWAEGGGGDSLWCWRQERWKSFCQSNGSQISISRSKTCPRSLDTTSSTVVKLSEGGIRRRPTSQFRDENKKLGEKIFQTAKTESDSMNDCFLVLFLASTNGFREHCLL